MHLKDFLLIAWISHQRSDVSFSYVNDIYVLPPTTQMCKEREVFLPSLAPRPVSIPKQGPQQGLSALARMHGAAGSPADTHAFTPKPHTPAALSFLFLHLLHTHQVPSRSWRPQAASPPSWRSTALVTTSVGPPVTPAVGLCQCLRLSPWYRELLVGRAARVCAHSAGYMVGP